MNYDLKIHEVHGENELELERSSFKKRTFTALTITYRPGGFTIDKNTALCERERGGLLALPEPFPLIPRFRRHSP